MDAIARIRTEGELVAVLSTKEAHQYVGGKPIWDELMHYYGDHLIPLRKAPKRGDTFWLISVIDRVLLLAQAEGTLVAQFEAASA